MGHRVYLYPIWIRLWHTLNALLCLALILTGLSMQYSDPSTGFIRFDVAVSIHNVAGIILTFSYMVYFVGNIVTPNGRYFRREPGNLFTNLRKQAWYYAFGVFKNEKPPFPIGKERKFNPLQKISYQFIMYMFLPIIIVTGWVMFFPATIIEEYLGFKGFMATDTLHIASGFFVSAFLIIHLYFSTMGSTPSEHYKSMITGYHEEHE